MSAEVRAQTSYDFTATFNNIDTLGNILLTGSVTNFGEDGINYPWGIASYSNFQVNGIPSNPIADLVGGTILTNGSYVINGGFSNDSDPTHSIGNYHLVYDVLYLSNRYTVMITTNSGPEDNKFFAYSSDFSTSVGYYGNSVVNASGGGGAAPEMNASFIPQVALMLGCLFFLFGRKKDATEVLLTA